MQTGGTSEAPLLLPLLGGLIPRRGTCPLSPAWLTCLLGGRPAPTGSLGGQAMPQEQRGCVGQERHVLGPPQPRACPGGPAHLRGALLRAMPGSSPAHGLGSLWRRGPRPPVPSRRNPTSRRRRDHQPVTPTFHSLGWAPWDSKPGNNVFLPGRRRHQGDGSLPSCREWRGHTELTQPAVCSEGSPRVIFPSWGGPSNCHPTR